MFCYPCNEIHALVAYTFVRHCMCTRINGFKMDIQSSCLGCETIVRVGNLGPEKESCMLPLSVSFLLQMSILMMVQMFCNEGH